jgi:SM-20-related protein
MTSVCNLDALRAAPLSRSPYDHLIVPGFIRKERLADIHRDYPAIDKPGSVPVGIFRHGPAFDDLLDELNGEAMRDAMEEKFSIDLSDRPTMVTVRGMCRPTDGKVHQDSASKIITILIYMNPPWEASGGRLRVLRSQNLEDYAAEVPPEEGTLLAFRRSETSWHGHEPFEGQRRAIQMNYVTHPVYVWHEQWRHRLSAGLKRLNPLA